MCKAFSFICLMIMISGFSFIPSVTAQSQTLILKSESGKTKEINLPKNGIVTVTIPFDSSSIECGSTTYIGTPSKIESGLLHMSMRREIFYGMDQDMKIKNEKNARRLKEPEIILNLDDAGRIAFKSKTANNIQGAGRLLATLGSITALIAAPLVSIQYSDGGFNSDRYFKVAGVGLAAVAVGIPLIYLAKPKTYVLKDFSGNKKELWSIQK